MIIVTNIDTLLSFRREADRQAAFYLRTRDQRLANDWSEFAALVTLAIQGRTGVRLILDGERTYSPIPIKAGEQDQQLPNDNVIKAFQ